MMTSLLQTDRFIFVGGAPRSGTTMVQNMLDNHSAVFGGPEFDWLPELARLHGGITHSISNGRLGTFFSEAEFSDCFRAFLKNMFGLSLARSGKKFFSEKTPDNVLWFQELHKVFPDARFLFVLRNPYAVYNSSLQAIRKARHAGTSAFGNSRKGLVRSIGKRIATGTKFLRENPECCMLVVYEELIADPEKGIRDICSFLGLEYEEAMLENSPSSAVKVAVAEHNSVSAFSTESMLKGGVNNERRDAWVKELSFLGRLGCRLYFKRHKLDILQRYGL